MDWQNRHMYHYRVGKYGLYSPENCHMNIAVLLYPKYDNKHQRYGKTQD